MLSVIDDLTAIVHAPCPAAKDLSCFESRCADAAFGERHGRRHSRVAAADDGNPGVRLGCHVATQVRHAIQNLRSGVNEVR